MMQKHKFEYAITISIDLGGAVPQVGVLLEKLNADLARAGFDEKLSVRSKMIACTLTTNRELTEGDRETVKLVLIDQFTASQPEWKAKIESFLRKSGNVQQSASSAS